MNRSVLTAALATAALAALATAAGATSIVNGSFEDGPTAANGYFAELGYGNPSIPGWTVGGNSIDYINPVHPYWVAADGHRAIDLSGSAPGSMSQVLSTTPGQAYTVSFEMAGNPDGAPHIKKMSVDINGLGVKDYTFDDSAVTSYAALGWTLEKYKFTATGASSVLTFTDLNTGSPYGAALDDVSIAIDRRTDGGLLGGSVGVPEPAAWAMMLSGFAGMGGVMRASRRRLAAVRA